MQQKNRQVVALLTATLSASTVTKPENLLFVTTAVFSPNIYLPSPQEADLVRV